MLTCAERGTPLFEAFRIADDVLRQAVEGISDLITIPGEVNVDFADVRTIMAGRGMALMGTGIAKGEHRALEAARIISDAVDPDANIIFGMVIDPTLDEVDREQAVAVLTPDPLSDPCATMTVRGNSLETQNVKLSLPWDLVR